MTEQLRVALYLRISTNEDNQRHSLDAQDHELRSFANIRQWCVTHVYRETASGKDTNRPEIQRMFEDASRREFDVLLIKRLDRLGRSITDLHDVAERLEQSGVALTSATEPFDTTEPTGRLMFSILGAFAQFERDIFRERIRAGLQQKRRNGEWSGATPIGFLLDPNSKRLVPDEEHRKTIELIFSLYVDHELGTTAVVRELNETGHRTRAGSPFNRNSVVAILKNVVYCGMRTHPDHDEPIAGQHEPLVSLEVFHSAQERLALDVAQKPWASRQPAETSHYRLTGLLRCSECGYALTGDSAKGGRFRYYVCGSRKRRHGICTSPRIPMAEIEDPLIEHLLSFLEDDHLLQEVLDAATSAGRKGLAGIERDLRDAEAQLREAKARQDRLDNQLLDGSLSPEAHVRLEEKTTSAVDSTSARVRELRRSLSEHQRSTSSDQVVRDHAHSLRDLLAQGNPRDINEALTELVDRVVIDARARTFCPTYRLPTSSPGSRQ